MIDWDVAISTGVRFARQGPQVSLADARTVVAELRRLTAVVQQPVRELTGLTSQAGSGPTSAGSASYSNRSRSGSPSGATSEPRPYRSSARSDLGPRASRRG